MSIGIPRHKTLQVSGEIVQSFEVGQIAKRVGQRPRELIVAETPRNQFKESQQKHLLHSNNDQQSNDAQFNESGHLSDLIG